MAKPIISRFYNYDSNEQRHTLSFVEGDDDDKSPDLESRERILTRTAVTDKVKTEKSVHFAKENESASFEDESGSDSLHTSKDIITWVPSEHLYSEDTFIPETVTGEKESANNQTTIPTDPSYGTSTFVELDTDDEETESIGSYTCTDSFASSGVFSSQNGSSHYRSWRDVTEIVKDIEDLEESEFVTRATTAQASFDEADATDADDSFEEQLARHKFIEHSIYRLLKKDGQSPRSVTDDSFSVVEKAYRQQFSNQQALNVTERKGAAKFCRQAMKRISQNDVAKNKTARKSCDEREISPLYREALKAKNPVLEHFGLSSSVMDRLRLENLHHMLHKKSTDLDKEIEASENFVNNHKYVEEENTKKQFLSQTCAHILRENMDERIQSHLIKMHPVKCFAEFVSELPKHSSDFREILYQYKRQLKSRADTATAEMKEG